MSEQDNTAIIQKMYAAFGSGDVQTIIDSLTPDVEWTFEGPATIPFTGRRVGHDEVLQFFQALATTQENQKLTITDYVAQGDKVATVGRYAGTVRATGKPFDSAVAHFFRFRGGKVAVFLDFGDTAHIVEAYTGAAASAGA